MRILVADDSLVMRRLLAAFLRSWNYEVIEAEDGEQAWSLFQKENISMVLTDWIMPEVDGLQLIRRIRATELSDYTYLILLTSKSEKEDLVTAMEAGADDFLVKPCDKEELRVRLREGERIIRLQLALAEQNRQLRETQAALVQSEKLASLGRLAAGMAHEINNPIAFVTNNLAVMRRDLGSLVALVDKYREVQVHVPSSASKLLDEVRLLEEDCDIDWLRQNLPQLLQSSMQGLARVRDIITNLSDFARLDQAAYDSLDIAKAVHASLELLRHLYEEKSLLFDLDLNSGSPIVCQPDKINQVIYNVLLNAIQASNPNSRIEVTLSAESKFTCLEIKDQGIGMDSATLERVFEPFFTTKPVGTGTGLGMALSFGIVRDHGGSIEIVSRPSEGASVRIRLPIKPIPIVSRVSCVTQSGDEDGSHR